MNNLDNKLITKFYRLLYKHHSQIQVIDDCAACLGLIDAKLTFACADKTSMTNMLIQCISMLYALVNISIVKA